MYEYDYFPDRVEFVIDKLGGPSKFARNTGVTLSTIARWRKGEAEPSRPNLVKIAEVANVSLEWLATGKSNEEEHLFENTKQSLNNDYCELPAYSNVAVSAGNGGFNDGITSVSYLMPFHREFLREVGLNERNGAVFWADGISMFPTIQDRDLLLVNLEKNQINDGKIYLVQNNGILWVKRVKLGWDSIELISDNAELYKPIIIPFNESENINVIGQVVHIGHSLI